METVKGMFSRKYGGVPAWVILLIAAGGVYLYMRHTGSTLFGNSGTNQADTTGDGSAASMEGQNPEIVFVPATGDSATNPQHPSHPAGPPATHTITAAQRAAAIMKDWRKHGAAYFHNHPGALEFLKSHAPKDYKLVTNNKGQPVNPSPPKRKPNTARQTISGKNPPRQQPHSGKVKVKG